MIDHATLIPITEETIPAVVEIVRELWSLCVYPMPYDARWTEGMTRTCINLPNYFARLAVLDDGTVCGIVAGSTCSMLFSPLKMGVQETIYVREGTKFRAAIGRQLFKAFINWAFLEQDVKFIRAGETSEICPKAVDAFFRSLGFKRAGTIYKKDTI